MKLSCKMGRKCFQKALGKLFGRLGRPLEGLGVSRGALGAPLVDPQAPSGGPRRVVGGSSRVLGMHRGELEGSSGGSLGVLRRSQGRSLAI